MRIGVLGGTFNPPHAGHLHAATAAKEALKLDTVILVPANQPPHKQIPLGSATPEQRLKMTELAAESIGARVSTIEFEREGKSYTADTLRELASIYKGAQLWLIMGTDMFLTVQNWYAPEQIFAVAHIAVVAREETRREEILSHKEKLEKDFDARVDIVDTHAIEVSSTRIRSTCAGKWDFVPESVEKFIIENKLYQNSGCEDEA